MRGFGGYNTRCALRIADDFFPLHATSPADLVTLWFGQRLYGLTIFFAILSFCETKVSEVLLAVSVPGANDAAVPDRLG